MNPASSLKPVILSVEDDEGHALLIRQNLEDSGINNRIEHFADGQAILDFFFRRGTTQAGDDNQTYVVLLDIRMPKVDGVEVLRRLKADPKLRTLPIIMLTTTDDAHEVERCHQIGCSAYMQKPVDYDKFSVAIRQLGHFISLLLVPAVARPSAA